MEFVEETMVARRKVEESNTSTLSRFSKYLDFLESLQCNDDKNNIPARFRVCDLIPVKLLKGALYEVEDLEEMESFPEAIIHHFINGKAKDFCYDVSKLCSEGYCDSLSAPRDTLTDNFRLSRVKAPTNSQSNTRFRSLNYDDSTNLSSGNSFGDYLQSTKRSHAEGNQISDVMIWSVKKKLPLVIFECKSSLGSSDIKEGMAQLVSHGLSLRDKKQIAHRIKLVLITPGSWYIAELPPYGKRSEINFEVDFVGYGKFGVLVKTSGGVFLDRKAYISILLDLRQHFKSLKSVR